MFIVDKIGKSQILFFSFNAKQKVPFSTKINQNPLQISLKNNSPLLKNAKTCNFFRSANDAFCWNSNYSGF